MLTKAVHPRPRDPPNDVILRATTLRPGIAMLAAARRIYNAAALPPVYRIDWL